MGKVEKVFILLMCMNLFLFVYFPLIDGTQNTQQRTLLSKFINLDSETPTISSGGVSGEISKISLSTDSAVVGESTLSLVSTMRMIWNAIKGILSFLFAPVIVMNSIPNIPSTVTLFVILPNILILVFGTISFLKGFDW